MADLVDQKIRVLYDRYKDRDYAANAQKEVEEIRRKAYLIGFATSAVAFAGNEFVRLTMRSPFFKLKAWNVLFWVAGPQILSQYYYRELVNERIDNMWRVHQNRVDNGLGGTYTSSNVYGDK
mmetsp:Transcript_40496/g.38994  ORF Transcript_40496/g.38994 Transcript_40496/m.38994 type:complete len:122 (+) Transcript_40496:21-386(+)